MEKTITTLRPGTFAADKMPDDVPHAGAPESGFINQVWRVLGGQNYLININTPYGIAWVMALFEGSVAFVMIAAVMKSIDPSLEEASLFVSAPDRVTGQGKAADQAESCRWGAMTSRGGRA